MHTLSDIPHKYFSVEDYSNIKPICQFIHVSLNEAVIEKPVGAAKRCLRGKVVGSNPAGPTISKLTYIGIA